MSPSFVVEQDLVQYPQWVQATSLEDLEKEIIQSGTTESLIRVLNFFVAKKLLTDEQVKNYAEIYRRGNAAELEAKVAELRPICFHPNHAGAIQYGNICRALNITGNLKGQYKFLLILSMLRHMIGMAHTTANPHGIEITNLEKKKREVSYCNWPCGLTVYFSIYCTITGLIILGVFGVITAANYQSYKFCPPEQNGTFENYTQEIAIDESCTEQVCHSSGPSYAHTSHCEDVLTTCTTYFCKEIAMLINTTLINGTAVDTPYPSNRTTARGVENGQAFWPGVWGMVGAGAWILLSCCIVPAIIICCNVAAQKSRRSYYDHKIEEEKNEFAGDCQELNKLGQLLSVLYDPQWLSYQLGGCVDQPVVASWRSQCAARGKDPDHLASFVRVCDLQLEQFQNSSGYSSGPADNFTGRSSW